MTKEDILTIIEGRITDLETRLKELIASGWTSPHGFIIRIDELTKLKEEIEKL